MGAESSGGCRGKPDARSSHKDGSAHLTGPFSFVKSVFCSRTAACNNQLKKKYSKNVFILVSMTSIFCLNQAFHKKCRLRQASGAKLKFCEIQPFPLV